MRPLIGMTLLLFAAVDPIAAQLCPRPAASWGYGPARAVTDCGPDLVCFSSGKVLLAANVSDSLAPQVVGELTLPEIATDMKFSGTLLAVVTRANGLHLIDMAIPTRPQLLGSLPVLSPNPRVALSGSLALVAAGALVIADISDPSAPVVLGSWGSNVRHVAVADGTVLVLRWQPGYRLETLDIGDPGSPTVIDSIEVEGRALDLEVSGSTAYVTSYRGSSVPLGPEVGLLSVIDTTDPTRLVERCVTLAGKRPGNLQLRRDQIVYTDGDLLRVGRLNELCSYEFLGFLNAGADLFDLALRDDTAYLAAHHLGLRLVDTSSPTEMEVLGAIETARPGRAVATAGSIALLASGQDGLRLFALPQARQLGRLQLPGEISDVAASGTRAWVTGVETPIRQVLYAVDVAVPEAPVVTAEVELAQMATHLVVADDLAIVALGSAGLRVFDVSDPGVPIEVGSHTTDGLSYERLAVSQGIAYVATEPGVDNLLVIDVRDPWVPTTINVLTPGWNIVDLTVSSRHAYLAVQHDDEHSLRILDVSDPTNIRETASLVLPPLLLATSVAVTDEIAVVGSTYDRAGVVVIDVADPYDPVEIGAFAPLCAGDLAVSRTHLAVADWCSSPEVLKISSCVRARSRVRRPSRRLGSHTP